MKHPQFLLQHGLLRGIVPPETTWSISNTYVFLVTVVESSTLPIVVA